VCRQALKGLDLPRRAADEFEWVVNLKTAKALGLTIPQSVLVRAEEVIQ
jgi:putative tryptophan/tyrosine transport system substrate-binding protein